MKRIEIEKLVAGTSDPAFAVDSVGVVIAWNQQAEVLFGSRASESIGLPCDQIVRGLDECGPVCSQSCTVLQSISKGQPISNFDIQMETVNGKQWCNVSVLIVAETNSVAPSAIHIVRPIELQKRFELLVRDFVIVNSDVSKEQAQALMSSNRSVARAAELTGRETEILRLLARGATTRSIAASLHISVTTVKNHIQHILQKLDARTRLEAIRRAERAGLI